MMQAKHIDVVHTLDLPQGNKTKDSDLNKISLDEQRIVVTKDNDFVNSFYVYKRPYKLLLITTGNITNKDLQALIESRLSQLLELFETCDFIELSRDYLVIHGDGEENE
jgi:predicted nuclease of predicted toxin-antitoxin system